MGVGGSHGWCATSQDPVLQYLNDVSRTNPEMVASFNQELRSPGKFMVLKQVQDRARKLVCGSGLGLR